MMAASAARHTAGSSVRLMKPGPAISVLGHLGQLAQFGCDLLGQVARLEAGVLGQRHRRIGGEIAVARLARRLDHDARQIGRARKHTGLARVVTAERTCSVKT
jgi:hypothetical protein